MASFSEYRVEEFALILTFGPVHKKARKIWTRLVPLLEESHVGLQLGGRV